jgi:hypothetical protein
VKIPDNMKKEGIRQECIQDRIIPTNGGYLYGFGNPKIPGISKIGSACITGPISIVKQRIGSNTWYLVNFVLFSMYSTVKLE